MPAPKAAEEWTHKVYPTEVDQASGRRRVRWDSDQAGGRQTPPRAGGGTYVLRVRTPRGGNTALVKPGRSGNIRGRIATHVSRANTGKGRGELYDMMREDRVVEVAVQQPKTDGAHDLRLREAHLYRHLETHGAPIHGRVPKGADGGSYSRADVTAQVALYGPESLPEPSPARLSKYGKGVATPKTWARIKSADLADIPAAVERIRKQTMPGRKVVNAAYEFRIVERGGAEQRYIGVAGDPFKRLAEHLTVIHSGDLQGVDARVYEQIRKALKEPSKVVEYGITRRSIPTAELMDTEKRLIEVKGTNHKNGGDGLNSTNGGNGGYPAARVTLPSPTSAIGGFLAVGKKIAQWLLGSN